MKSRFRKFARASLAGLLVLGGGVTTAVIAGAGPASAASVVQTIAVGAYPVGVSSDGTHVWVANTNSNTVTELNASDGSVVQTVSVGSGPWGVSSDGTHVWVANTNSNSVTELNASDGSVVQTIGVGSYPSVVSSDGTHVWVSNFLGSSVTELNASNGAVVQTIGVGHDPYGVSSDGTHVWVASLVGNSVTELNASDGSVVQTIGVGSQPYGVSLDGTHVWVANRGGNSVTELNASNGAVVQTIGVGSQPIDVSSDGTHVWVANSISSTVTELNASDGSVVQTIGVGSGPLGVSLDGSHVWVSNSGSNSVTELDTRSAQTITFAPLANQSFGASPFNVTASASSGLAVSFTSPTPAVCTVSGSTVTVVGLGACTIVASQAGDALDLPASDVQQTFTVGQGSQTVAFSSSNPTPVSVGGPTYSPTATGGASTSPVVISLDATSTGCTLTTGVVAFTAAGTCVIDANQAGDANYLAAAQVRQTITVGKGSQVVAFSTPAPTSTPVGGPTYSPTATGGASTSPVVISLDATSTGCTLTTGVVAFTAAGTCVIDANQAGDANYLAAAQVRQAFLVGFRITTASLPSATPGSVYSPVTLGLASVGASAIPYVTTIKWAKGTVVAPAGALPKGMKLSKTGVLSGTPSTKLVAGTTSVTVKVTETVTTLNGRKKVKTKTTVQATIPLTIN